VKSMEKLIDRKSPLLFSHRGGAGLFPENTILAYRQSVEQFHADMVELDIHMSADGELVVIHDNTVDRTTNGTGTVRDMPLKEIRKLDAGWRFTADGGKTYPYRGKGITIPTLREVFSALKDYEVGINIEIKKHYRNIENKLYNLITGFHMADRVIVVSGHRSVMKRFRKINRRGIVTAADAVEGVKVYLLQKMHMGHLYRPMGEALQVPFRFKGMVQVATESLVSLCRENGIRLHVWTINDGYTMKKLLDWKVDGIITDYPDRLYQLFREYGYK